MVKVTQEMLDADPTLLESGVQLGDEIELKEVLPVETKTFYFHPSEKEVVDLEGNVNLEWTDAAGSTFKQRKP